MKGKTGEKKPKFSLTHKDESMEKLVKETDQRASAVRAIGCAGRVLPYFEENYPEDPLPKNALGALHAWIQSRVFRMADIRRASLAAHASVLDSPAHFPPSRGLSEPRQREELSSDNSSNGETSN